MKGNRIDWKKHVKKGLTYLGVLALFIGIAYGFVPEVLDGKVVNPPDTVSWKGMTHEISEHNAQHPDDKTYWTNSMFGGMPTAAMYDDFDGDGTKPIYEMLMWGKRPANWLLVSLIGAFLLMLAFGIDTLIAVAGAIAITFCSYNMQIIQVGHNTKMQAIAFMPWVLAALVFTYRSAMKDREDDGWKKWLPQTLLGAVLFALAVSFQVKANHPQISYYLAIIIFTYVLTLFISILCKKIDMKGKMIRFFAASGLLLAVGSIGIATNANKLLPTLDYAKYTMRGGSELSGSGDGHSSKGLDLKYATQWSYGVNEMPNLMIANFNGGASSGALDMDSEVAKVLLEGGYKTSEVESIIKNMPLYNGPQPFTAGPMYLGAITVFLFILGLILYNGKEKWWLLAASIIAIFLAWGSHFMWFTRLWFDFAPMYNKFRTVSMALTALQLTFPILGFLVLDKILKDDDRMINIKLGWIAYALTGGFCLLLALIPSLGGDFTSPVDANFGWKELSDALAADRKALLARDATLSWLWISFTWALIRLNRERILKNRKLQTILCGALITLMVAINLFATGKRYLNEDHFVVPNQITGQFRPSAADKEILQDKDPNFRVLNLSTNTFNDAITSYHHKSIGGYSPVKMQRYQDLIDRYLSREINKAIDSINSTIEDGVNCIEDIEDALPYLPIISMLNGRYIIISPKSSPLINDYVFGNAWFVDSFALAKDPDEEIALLGKIDLETQAVLGKDFEDQVSRTPMLLAQGRNENDIIVFTSYAPNELHYEYYTEYGGKAIFSEIYHPDWKAYIIPHGTEQKLDLELFRANWILRGAILPQGRGELVMRYEPKAYVKGEKTSKACSAILYLLLLASVGGILATRRDSSPSLSSGSE